MVEKYFNVYVTLRTSSVLKVKAKSKKEAIEKIVNEQFSGMVEQTDGIYDLITRSDIEKVESGAKAPSV